MGQAGASIPCRDQSGDRAVRHTGRDSTAYYSLRFHPLAVFFVLLFGTEHFACLVERISLEADPAKMVELEEVEHSCTIGS